MLSILCILAGAEGEIVELNKPGIDVDAGLNFGNTERWLGQVEDAMRASLREITDRAISDYAVFHIKSHVGVHTI